MFRFSRVRIGTVVRLFDSRLPERFAPEFASHNRTRFLQNRLLETAPIALSRTLTFGLNRDPQRPDQFLHRANFHTTMTARAGKRKAGDEGETQKSPKKVAVKSKKSEVGATEVQPIVPDESKLAKKSPAKGKKEPAAAVDAAQTPDEKKKAAKKPSAKKKKSEVKPEEPTEETKAAPKRAAKAKKVVCAITPIPDGLRRVHSCRLRIEICSSTILKN